MNKERVLLGAVAYTPAVVEIWEGIKDYFNENGCPFDFVLFSNYEAQVDALLDGFIDIAWNTNLAFIKCDLALSGKARIEAGLAAQGLDIGHAVTSSVSRDGHAPADFHYSVPMLACRCRSVNVGGGALPGSPR